MASLKPVLLYTPTRGSAEITLSFSSKKRIGHGSYGTVYSVGLDEGGAEPFAKRGAILALKVLHHDTIREEIRSILMGLNHTSVVNYIAIGKLPFGTDGLESAHPQTAVLMEFYSGGTLQDYSLTKQLDKDEVLKFLHQIVSAVKYLHQLEPPVFHGDIKGENIFLTSDHSTCKLGDMENFRLLIKGRTDTGGLKVKAGTLLHMSPEMMSYSFGDKDEDEVVLTDDSAVIISINDIDADISSLEVLPQKRGMTDTFGRDLPEVFGKF
ncbi:hypothetical protein BV898_19584 [Hypsibius exemplaris]|uniref:Protein kinase domain-containing protein n=1 Tax=Hypsibius exemplaris TaxID=2072580 RepID=A0A9X6NR02_HYPEX|nr:hypothetical protein BV898_19584 [Hypsibius exemplaris]